MWGCAAVQDMSIIRPPSERHTHTHTQPEHQKASAESIWKLPWTTSQHMFNTHWTACWSLSLSFRGCPSPRKDHSCIYQSSNTSWSTLNVNSSPAKKGQFSTSSSILVFSALLHAVMDAQPICWSQNSGWVAGDQTLISLYATPINL